MNMNSTFFKNGEFYNISDKIIITACLICGRTVEVEPQKPVLMCHNQFMVEVAGKSVSEKAEKIAEVAEKSEVGEVDAD